MAQAAGSSLLYKLTNALTLDLLRRLGLASTRSALVVPLATGMALSLVLLYMRRLNPRATVVVMPRIDQKTCVKCVQTAGLRPLVVENALEGDEVRTSLSALTNAIDRQLAEAPGSILCVMTVNSCFAPRTPDRLVEVAELCQARGLPHLVNNAYGLQAAKCVHVLEAATRRGRVDAFVQSTDKNLMVPVGGAIIASRDAAFVEAVSQSYPGRASSGPILDVFVTLLSMGWAGYSRLLAERESTLNALRQGLAAVAARHGERLLATPHNPISIGMTLTRLDAAGRDPGDLGGALFVRGVSGTRVVTGRERKSVAGIVFGAYGSHLGPIGAEGEAAVPGGPSEAVVSVGGRIVPTLVPPSVSATAGARPANHPPPGSPPTTPRSTEALGAELLPDASAVVTTISARVGYPVPYLTCAGALGMRRDEVDEFCARLDRTLSVILGTPAQTPPPPQPVGESFDRDAVTAGSATALPDERPTPSRVARARQRRGAGADGSKGRNNKKPADARPHSEAGRAEAAASLLKAVAPVPLRPEAVADKGCGPLPSAPG